MNVKTNIPYTIPYNKYFPFLSVYVNMKPSITPKIGDASIIANNQSGITINDISHTFFVLIPVTKGFRSYQHLGMYIQHHDFQDS